MRIFKITINTPSFYSKDDRQALIETEKEKLAAIISQFKSMRPYDDYNIYVISEKELIDLMLSVPMGRSYDDTTCITKIELLMDTGDVNGSIAAMIDRLELAAARVSEHAFSSHTQSPIVGNHLMTVNDLMLCEDYCTDALQEKLDAGWRIIAVCPQEARRPDYVLGRNGDSTGRARRG